MCFNLQPRIPRVLSTGAEIKSWVRGWYFYQLHSLLVYWSTSLNIGTYSFDPNKFVNIEVQN
jgi:hypothetical protein